MVYVAIKVERSIRLNVAVFTNLRIHKNKNAGYIYACVSMATIYISIHRVNPMCIYFLCLLMYMFMCIYICIFTHIYVH